MDSNLKTLRLILGDQLNSDHSWFKTINDNMLYVMMEVRQETDYVIHHIQKIIAFFASMREFAEQLKEAGHRVHYIELDDSENTQSIADNLLKLIHEKKIHHFEYQLPDEYRLDQELQTFCNSLEISSQAVNTEHFLSERTDLRDHFEGKKQYLMESFYRMMRKRYQILIENNKPVGGKWNFDIENRKKYDGKISVPEPLLFQNDIRHLKLLLEKMKVVSFGFAEDFLIWPKNRQQSMQLLEYFLIHGLPYFGTYQDAMAHAYWSLFHSRISFAMNTKMLHPMEIMEAAIQAWQDRQAEISLPQIEGFIRQILGWREYMRGVYWAQMPNYKSLNYFGNQHSLPHYYWDADTKMECMHKVISQSLKYAYAHHIQRLMITGNFALLTGIHPDEVDAWYLGVYIDAIEWVEITNTRGMSQFADGGLIATKPYISTANYIHKMSDYCDKCYYDRKKKVGDRSCPFNSLYWSFFDRHRDKLGRNPRLGMIYRLLGTFSSEEVSAIKKQADWYIEHSEEL